MTQQQERVDRKEAEKITEDIKKLSPVQRATVKGFLLGMKVRKATEKQ